MRHRVEVSLVLAILALAIVLLISAPNFFSAANLVDILLATLPVLIVATGATLVVLTGEIDISVGSVFAVAAVVTGVSARGGAPMPIVIVLAVFAGAVLGAINGALVSALRLPSIVVTLAAMVAWRDALKWATQGAWIQKLPGGFQWFGLGQHAYPVVAIGTAVVLAVAVAWALRYLPSGRAIYATGSNADAARLSGIDTARVRFLVFVAAGACTGLAAAINAVRFNQVPSNAGVGLEMQVIAAVVVGGTAVNGGRGTVAGTVLGVTLLGVIGPALTFLGASAYWERALQGAIILGAVAIDAYRSRRVMAIAHPAGKTRDASA